MANQDLFKQAIAEAKSVREAAIANAKDALEESPKTMTMKWKKPSTTTKWTKLKAKKI